jgi:hypothetical protein
MLWLDGGRLQLVKEMKLITRNEVLKEASLLREINFRIQEEIEWQKKKSMSLQKKFRLKIIDLDRLCGLVVRLLGYRSRGLGSIPCSTRFSEK